MNTLVRVYGHLRGQIHFWGGPEGSQKDVCKRGFGPGQGYGCVRDWLLVEMDQDYNWIHDSSTECTYMNNYSGFRGSGRQYYQTGLFWYLDQQ
jgi:hypothetical protein